MQKFSKNIFSNALIILLFMTTICAGTFPTSARSGGTLEQGAAKRANPDEIEDSGIDGFYVGYFTAIAGSGAGMFVFMNGRISGADIGGVLMNGRYSVSADGLVHGTVGVEVPPNLRLIFGVETPPDGLKYNVNFKTSLEEIRGERFTVFTPLGPAKVRLVKTGPIELH